LEKKKAATSRKGTVGRRGRIKPKAATATKLNPTAR
jgi:hypothetical protein